MCCAWTASSWTRRGSGTVLPRGGPRWKRAGTPKRPRRCARRWICGAARCSPTWPTTRLSGPRRPGWRSCGWPRLRPGSRLTWRWAGPTRSPPSWSSWPASIRCGSGCTSSSCWRCTGAAGRPKRSPPTGGSAICSPTSSASTPGNRCGACTHQFSPRTRRSTGTVAAGPRPKITRPSPPSLPRRPNHLAGGWRAAGSWPGRGGAPAACWPSARRSRSPRPCASSRWPGRGRASRPACRVTVWA